MKTGINQQIVRPARWLTIFALSAVFALVSLGLTKHSMAASASAINRDVNIALQQLYASTPVAKQMAGIAKGILVFPDIIKGGFIIGGQYGEGALRVGSKTRGYYRTVAASYGLQAGAQKFGYALFFLSDADLKYLKNSGGWEIGVGPSVVVMDEGVARSFSTTTARSGVYAFFFDQKGLMAGLGIQGSKITEIQPNK